MPEAAAEARVVALCVTYFPDRARLSRVLSAVANQVERVLVLDNSESAKACEDASDTADAQRAEYVSMGGNRGLASAYNRGLEWARERGASHVLLLDQDNIAESDMVAELLIGLAEASASLDGPVYTVGPGYVDELSGRRSAVLRSGRFALQRVPRSPVPWQPTEMLISSGSLLPLAAVDALGEFDAELFIDHIDTDWALRVQHAGGYLVVVHGARMSHRLGDSVQRLWWGHTRTLPVHAPIRLYYIFRNSLLLFRRPQAHWRWVIFDLQRLAVVSVVHLLAPGPRWQRLALLCRGLLDGARGRSGAVSDGAVRRPGRLA